MRLTRLDFDSDILGLETFSLDLDEAPNSKKLSDCLRSSQPVADLVVCRVAADDEHCARTLRIANFDEMETLVTLERQTTPQDNAAVESRIRIGNPNDHAEIARIARGAFLCDRYHADPRIPNARADEIKARWAANDLNGRAAMPLVAVRHTKIAGFCMVLEQEDRLAIDLIAVDSTMQRQGLGAALTRETITRAASLSRSVTVGTQSANASSLALYESLGFHESKRRKTFHWHRSVD